MGSKACLDFFEPSGGQITESLLFDVIGSWKFYGRNIKGRLLVSTLRWVLLFCLYLSERDQILQLSDKGGYYKGIGQIYEEIS